MLWDSINIANENWLRRHDAKVLKHFSQSMDRNPHFPRNSEPQAALARLYGMLLKSDFRLREVHNSSAAHCPLAFAIRMHRVPAFMGVGRRRALSSMTRGCRARYCGNFHSYLSRSRPVAESTNSRPSLENITTTGSPRIVFSCGEA